jgi:hypothetical protein
VSRPIKLEISVRGLLLLAVGVVAAATLFGILQWRDRRAPPPEKLAPPQQKVLESLVEPVLE